MSECIRVEAAPVDFNAEHFFQPDVTEMDASSKMIQKGKLAWLVRGFKDDGVEPECIYKAVCVCRIQKSILIKQSDSPCAFSGFDDELDRTRIEPFLALVNPRRQRLPVKTAVMLLPKLHLNVESATPGGSHNLFWIEMALGESLAAFNSRDPDVRAKVQVGRKFSLSHGNFKRPSACYGGDSVRTGRSDFHPGGTFIRNHPAGHRDLQARNKVPTLFNMAY